MKFTRRHTIGLGAALMSAVALAPQAFAQDIDNNIFPTDGGEVIIHPVSHASFVMETPGMVIYVDPVGGADLYADFPEPDLILITHEHGDHYEADTLSALAGDAQLLTNPAVFDMLEDQSMAEVIANGESTTVGEVTIDAVPAYNTTEDRLMYHPEGRDNGYVLGIDGLRVYIASDTEDTPEFRGVEDVDVAFVPMNMPYTMTPDQAADGVAELAPAVVYPYHYGGDIEIIEEFERLLEDAGAETEVIRGAWYPG